MINRYILLITLLYAFQLCAQIIILGLTGELIPDIMIRW